MDSLIIYTSCSVMAEDLRAFISERGGYWNRGPALDEGVIEAGSGALYVSSTPAFVDELESDELIALTAKLGKPPVDAISIHIGGADRPYAVATRIAREMADRWRGYVYGQDGAISEP